MMRLLAWAVAAALVCLGFVRNAHAFGFSVEPSRVELTVTPGKRRGVTVIVNNSQSSEPLQLTLYVRDIVHLPDGAHDFPAPGSTEWSCAKWLRVVPDKLSVPAGKTAQVRISALSPPDARGGHYATVFFETRPSATDQPSLSINFRLGALVEVLTPNTEIRQAKLANLAFEPSHKIRVEIFNEGNVLIRPTGKLKVFDAEQRRVAQVELNPQQLGILPKMLRVYTVQLEPSLPTGAYHLKTEIDYGTPYLLIGERAFAVE